MDANVVVSDVALTPAIEQATRRAEDIRQAISLTVTMGEDRAEKLDGRRVPSVRRPDLHDNQNVHLRQHATAFS